MANPDSTLLSWITAEVNQALTVVREHIAKFSAEPGNGALLQPCAGHLHQVAGALRMVGLNGATRFCEAIEGGFSLNGSQPGGPVMEVLDRAVLSLKEFVEGLERGHPNVPLRLYPMYRELGALQGRPDAPEKDLFYPDLGTAAPMHPEPRELPKHEIAPFLQAQRVQFQRGLLGWIRNQPSGLEDMTQAVQALHQLAAQLPEPRALWWAVLGLIDVLKSSKDSEWLASAKPLCNKIDFHMRDLAAGAGGGGETLLREVLYAVGKAKTLTPRAREVRSLYQLDGLFPAPSERAEPNPDVTGEWLEAALYDMHSRLEALKTAWVHYISGEQKTAGRFRELVGSFRTKAAELGNQHLIKLLDAIDLVKKHLPDPYPASKNQFMVIEMASTFLLVESVIDNFTTPPEDLEQQIVILGGWLLDSAKGRSNGEPPPGLRGDLVQKIGALQLRAQVAKEISANLQHMEQVVDAFARDPAKRDTMTGLKPFVRQVHGALKVLGFDRAGDTIAVCESMIDACAVDAPEKAAEQLDWIAEGLSSVGFYLDPCLKGRDPAESALDLFFQRFGTRIEKAEEAAALAAAAAAVVQQSGASAIPADKTGPLVAEPAPAMRAGVDPDLLGIFLDEAAEVLQRIEATLPLCKKQPNDTESLTVIRRAFHTLKGSGRMVGLMDLGEVAWEIEQVMNLWLEEKRPATAELVDLLGDAGEAFYSWVAKLRDGRLQEEVDGSKLIRAARQIKSGDARPAEPAVDEITIGETTLSRAFFEIYIKEALEHVATLEAGFAAWRSEPGADTSQSFARAAHTLASSSGTAGFTELRNLASAVEQWIPVARQTRDAHDIEVLEASILRLRAMTDAMARREGPGESLEQAVRLKTLTERLEATTPPSLDIAALLQPIEAAAEAAAQAPADLAVPHIDLDLDLDLDGPAPVAAAAPPPPPKAPAAVPAPAAETSADADGRAKRVMRDDIDEQLLPIFLEEAEQLVPAIGGDLREWKANPADEKVSQSLRRSLHTLKGSARMAGAIRLGELTHIMESRIEAAIEANAYPPELFTELEDKMDRLSSDVDRMRAPPAEPEAPVEEAAAVAAPVRGQEPAKPRVAEAPLQPTAMLRINADTLDQLINEAGEVSIARSRIEAELRLIRGSLNDLSESIGRLRGQLREIEVQADSQMQSRMSVLEERKSDYDPLEFDRYTRLQELTRLMAESLNDVLSIQQGLAKNLGETDAALLAQNRTTRDVQQELMRMRAVPFSNLNERLYRIVRQTARETDKKAELDIEGAEVELDRSVLERIGAPLEHMLRNSLAHGIELPADRIAAGKPESGRITVSLRQEANEIALIVSDDGAGIDVDRLHRKAIERGLVAASQKLSDAEKVQLIFASGLSTAETVTQLAGRGVGMDVVRSEITAIGGRVDIATERGKGTAFTVYLPLTLAVTQAVLIRVGTHLFALSTAMVEQVLRLKSDGMSALYNAKRVEFQGRDYPLHSLQYMMGGEAATEIQGYNSVLLLRSGIQRIALHVDELLGNQEIVVKSVGPQLARVAWIVGATVLADGSIVPIINPVVLAQRSIGGAATFEATTLVPRVGKAEAPAAPTAPVVMVVDDSLTVRKITSRLLEREGYQVLTAKDGIDALEQLRETLPAVMLVDIEMPRMDGFDLTRNVRGDPRTKDVPIIIISSRTAEKHRSQAAALGVNAFLGKPYQESDLLQQILGFVGTAVH